MARQALDAGDKGYPWMVVGVPGLISADGTEIGQMPNVAGLQDTYKVRDRLEAADPAAGRLLDQGFHLVPVNDGTLGAHAAAARVGRNEYDRTAVIIVGTGIGAGVVTKDSRYTNVHRHDPSQPTEIGQIPVSANPRVSFEGMFSGPAIRNRYGSRPPDLGRDHPVWRELGTNIGRLAMTLGMMHGVTLVVPTGGVAAGASESYRPHLEWFMEEFAESGNSLQRRLTPEVAFMNPADCQTFEMYGAEGVMTDYLTQPQLPQVAPEA